MSSFGNIKKGLLHKSLGISEGSPIPTSELEKHKNSPDAHMRKMVNFALNAKKFKHKGR